MNLTLALINLNIAGIGLGLVGTASAVFLEPNIDVSDVVLGVALTSISSIQLATTIATK